jgi:chromosome segregation ATPase
MIFNTRTSSAQDQISAIHRAIREMLAPLQQTVPELYAELSAACDSRYTPQRLGEILRMHLTVRQEQAEQEYARREEQIRRRFDKELKELKDLVKEQEKEIRNLKGNKAHAETERDEALLKLASQNNLIASLHQQIQNLQGGSSVER